MTDISYLAWPFFDERHRELARDFQDWCSDNLTGRYADGVDSEGFAALGPNGLDVLLRGLSMVRGDEELLALSGPLFDGLYEYRKRALLTGREPA